MFVYQQIRKVSGNLAGKASVTLSQAAGTPTEQINTEYSKH